MPYNPGGVFSLVASYFANPGTTIRTEQHNPVFEDVGSALSQVLLRDGRAPMTGALNMNGFPINGVAAGTTPSSVATLAQAMPLGAVIDYAGVTTAPAGWMLCYGQAISRTTYSALYNLIGTAYGIGDGSTTFNLPDLRGRVAAGYDAMGGSPAGRLSGGYTAGIGIQSVPLTQQELPQVQIFFGGISSTVSVTSGTPDFLRGVVQTSTFNYDIGGGAILGAISNGTLTSNAVSSSGNFTPQGNIITTGGTNFINGGGAVAPHNNVQPTIIMSKIIRVSYDG